MNNSSTSPKRVTTFVSPIALSLGFLLAASPVNAAAGPEPDAPRGTMRVLANPDSILRLSTFIPADDRVFLTLYNLKDVAEGLTRGQEIRNSRSELNRLLRSEDAQIELGILLAPDAELEAEIKNTQIRQDIFGVNRGGTLNFGVLLDRLDTEYQVTGAQLVDRLYGIPAVRSSIKDMMRVESAGAFFRAFSHHRDLAEAYINVVGNVKGKEARTGYQDDPDNFTSLFQGMLIVTKRLGVNLRGGMEREAALDTFNEQASALFQLAHRKLREGITLVQEAFGRAPFLFVDHDDAPAGDGAAAGAAAAADAAPERSPLEEWLDQDGFALLVSNAVMVLHAQTGQFPQTDDVYGALEGAVRGEAGASERVTELLQGDNLAEFFTPENRDEILGKIRVIIDVIFN